MYIPNICPKYSYENAFARHSHIKQIFKIIIMITQKHM